ncbi:MAG: signal peptidase I [Candidatus Izemoplasmatales bacterium]
MENSLKNNTTTKKVLNIIFYIVLAVVFIYAVFGLFSKKNNNAISFLGIESMSVQTPSMSPTFDEGDLIFIDTDFVASELLPDIDVITYRTFKIIDGEKVEYYNTHRIVSKTVIGDRIQFVTRGDANEDSEEFNDPAIWDDDIYAVYTGKKLSNFGGFVDGFTTFLKSSIGFLLFIVVPCLALLVYEVIKFMKIYAEYNVQKSTHDRVKMQEEAIAVAKAQLEAEAQVKKANKEEKDQPE